MRLSEVTERLPENLSRQAAHDLIALLRRSATEFGIATARQSAERILARCHSIGAGTAVGHHRSDIMPRTPTLFISEPPWVISYNPKTRQVTRIVHGARDFPSIFG